MKTRTASRTGNTARLYLVRTLPRYSGWCRLANGDFSAGGPVVSDSFDGGVLGAFAGYNYQFDNNFVLGIEGDVDYNWNDNDYAGVNVGTDWQGSVRGRVGYAFDRALIYGTAGWTATRGFIETPGGKDSTTLTVIPLAQAWTMRLPTTCSAAWNIVTTIMATRTSSASIPISISTRSKWASV